MGNGSAVGMASRCACTWAVTVAGTSAVGAGCGAVQASTPMIKRAAMSSSLISAFSRNNLWVVPDRAATGWLTREDGLKRNCWRIEGLFQSGGGSRQKSDRQWVTFRVGTAGKGNMQRGRYGTAGYDQRNNHAPDLFP